MIRHLWLDYSETIASINTEVHDRLRYESYAAIVGRVVSPELITEYEDLYQKNERSNSAVFRSLGQTSNYWSERINSVDPTIFYRLADPEIPGVLRQLKDILPVSLFSNIELQGVLLGLDIDPRWFKHILSSGQVPRPKPALDGFRKIVEMSGIPAGEILYVGDDVGKDVRPAKAVGIKTGLMWKMSAEADYCFKNFEALLETIEAQK